MICLQEKKDLGYNMSDALLSLYLNLKTRGKGRFYPISSSFIYPRVRKRENIYLNAILSNSKLT